MSLRPHIKHLMLKHVESNPVPLTYLAIGSTNNKDQQLPPFIQKYNIKTRIILLIKRINKIEVINLNFINCYFYGR